MAQSNNVYLMAKAIPMLAFKGCQVALIGDLVTDALSVSRALGKQTGETARSNLLRMLDGQAANVAALINDRRRDAAGKPIVD